MILEYAIFWLMGAAGFFGWVIALVLSISNFRRLARIERMLKGSTDA